MEPSHLLSIYVLLMIPVVIHFARRHKIRAHARPVIGMLVGGLVIAGRFTFLAWPHHACGGFRELKKSPVKPLEKQR